MREARSGVQFIVILGLCNVIRNDLFVAAVAAFLAKEKNTDTH